MGCRVKRERSVDFSRIIKTRRSIRRFKKQRIARSILIELLDVARSAPSAGNRQPVEYIVVDEPGTVQKVFEQLAWAAIENILLAAWSKGVGSCWLGSVQRDNIRELLGIPAKLQIDSVVALGYPDEEPVMEEAKDNSEGAVRYYLDEADRLHVPKRKLNSIGHLNEYGCPIE